MLMEEVSCNSGAEEFGAIGDTETFNIQSTNQRIIKTVCMIVSCITTPDVQVAGLLDHPEASVW